MNRARLSLVQAGLVLRAGVPDGAARYAYMAAFHAAQALLFERHRRVFKTHSGVRGEFACEVRGAMDPTQAAFLARGYEMKVVADYEGEPDDAIGPEQAEEAMREAERFIEAVAAIFDKAHT